MKQDKQHYERHGGIPPYQVMREKATEQSESKEDRLYWTANMQTNTTTDFRSLDTGYRYHQPSLGGPNHMSLSFNDTRSNAFN